MAATTPFRITPNLGPDLWQTQPAYYWDEVAQPHGLTGKPTPSYQLGVTVNGNDGKAYIHVTAAAALTAGSRVNINRTTWVATANATGTHVAPSAVAAGDAFQAGEYFA